MSFYEEKEKFKISEFELEFEFMRDPCYFKKKRKR